MAIIRNKDTGTKEFSEVVSEIAGLLTYEITRNLETVEKEIQTPIMKTKVNVLASDIVIVPILRAGLGMLDGIKKMIPSSRVGFIGLYRDEKNFKAVNYFTKLPNDLENSTILVCDPMLATGNTAISAIDKLKTQGAINIIYVGIIGCPEGIENLRKSHPNVPIYLAALDDKLNDKKYIEPGLGDCGDRLFGTK
jgi:uracil phosphoribosyltransferase